MKATLVAQRDAKLAEAKAVVAAAEAEGRDITDAELATVKEAREAADALNARIAEIDALAASESRAVTSGAVGSIQVTKEPETYRKDGPNSFLRDLFLSSTRGDRDASERLDRHSREMRAMDNSSSGPNVGSDLTPPMWIVDEFVSYARAGRVAADTLPNEAAPAGTNVINLPKLTAGASAAGQSGGQNTAFDEQTVETSVSTSAFHTVGGVQVASVQLLEQSPNGIVERAILKELASAHAQEVDKFVLSSNTTGKYGLLNVPSSIGITYTDTSPAVTGAGKFWDAVAAAKAGIHGEIFRAADTMIVTPARWEWILSGMDDVHRPLIVPAVQGPWNAAGTTAGTVAEGYAGRFNGLDVYVDANIGEPTTGQDAAIILRKSEFTLYESAPKFETFRETYANQGSVLFRAYSYVSLQSERRPKAVAVITGSGMAVPSFGMSGS